MTFRTDATIDQVEPGRAGSSGEPPTGQAVAGLSPGGADRPDKLPAHRGGRGRLLRLLWPLGPLVAWLLQRQTAADLRRLSHLLEAPATSGPTQEGTATSPLNDAAADDPPGD